MRAIISPYFEAQEPLQMLYSNPKSFVQICRGSAPVPTPRIGATTGGLPLQQLHNSFRIAI